VEKVPYWSVENDNPVRVVSYLHDSKEGDVPKMTSIVLSDFFSTFEVFSILLS
jgi:hypothetical protein